MRTPLSKIPWQRRFLATLAVVALPAALLLPASAASAAVSASASSAANKTAAVNKTSAASPAAQDKGVDTAKPVPKPRTRPTPPAASAKPAPISAAALRQVRAAAAKSAIARDSEPDTCSGAISPDLVYPCTTPSSTGTDSFTVNVAEAPDLLIIQVLSTDGNALPFTLTAPDSAAVTCVADTFGQIPQCATSASGAYTLAVTNQSADFTVSYVPLLSDTTCGAVNPSFAAAPIEAAIAADAVGACYTLNVPSGHTVTGDLATDTTSYLETLLTVYDSTGAQICFAQQGTCALTGTGPYRVLIDNYQGTAFSYGFELDDLTAHTGCVTATQQSYGTAPDDSSSNECRELTVTTAGDYQVYGASDWQLGGISGLLYAADGSVACTNSGPFCQLSPGSYFYVETEDPLAPYDFAVVFIAADESRGCTATGDTDFATGPATAAFSGVGEVVCLNLPTVAGKSAYVFDERVATTAYAAPLLILDATGAQQCTNLYNGAGICTPTGTAPFRMLLASQQSSDTGYKVIVQATDSTAGCLAWPQSGFGGSWGATAATSATSNFVCLSLPAGQHATGEMVDYDDTTHTEDGGIQINDPTGATVCNIFTTSICKYQAAVNYTAILSNTGQDQTYHLVRRDVTQSASCGTPASTAFGGPSTGFVLDSALDTTCYRVTAAATDDLWFDVRTLAPYRQGAVLFITDGTGAFVCGFSTVCQVTGSTDYQVITDTLGYTGIAIPAHLDTWLVATASGPAGQCQSHQLSTSGWAPISATLTESATAYCAAIPVQPNEDFAVYGTDSATAGQSPLVRAYPLTGWGTSYAMCNGFGSCYTGSATGQAILVVSLLGVQGPMDFTMQGVCQFGCTGRPGQATLSAVSPASQPAGTGNEVTVTGSNLNLGTEVMLATNGNPVSTNWISQPVSVDAAGTTLTVRLDTSGVAPGKYDVMLNANYSEPTSTPGYLVGAYTVTAGPTPPANSAFVPVTPSRILNTKTGVGAPKARVAAGATLVLNVSRAGAVPKAGVTAVAVDLTVVNPSAGGNLVAYGDGAPRPGTTDVTFSAGANATNLAIVPVANGKIDLYNGSRGAVDLTADVDGYYTGTGTGSAFTALTQTQICGSGGTGVRPCVSVPAHSTSSINALGVGGVPTSAVTAVLLGVTTIKPQASGSLTVYDGSARPDVTDASFSAGRSVSNLVLVPVSDGKVTFYNGSAGSVGLAVSVQGYYSASGASFRPFGPQRVLDTRSGLGGSGLTVVPGGAAFLSSFPGVPYTATSVVVNITLAGAQSPGTLTLVSPNLTVPAVSNVAFGPGQAVSDTVVVPFGTSLFFNKSSGTVQVIADVEGYFTS